MITLDLPPKIEWEITQQAQKSGLSLEHYLIQHISELAQSHSKAQKNISVAQFVQGKRLESFSEDPLALQKEWRNEDL